MNVILISGKQGSGKTTLQRAIARDWTRWGGIACQVNFADVLYEMHDAVRTVGDRYGVPKKLPKDGKLLQLLGTDWGRSLNSDLWVNVLKNRIGLLEEEYGSRGAVLVIVGDCRFPNELESFPGALKVRLECEDGVRRRRCSQWREDDQHQSETALDAAATAGAFDLYIATDVLDERECVEHLMRKLTHEINDAIKKARTNEAARSL